MSYNNKLAYSSIKGKILRSSERNCTRKNKPETLPLSMNKALINIAVSREKYGSQKYEIAREESKSEARATNSATKVAVSAANNRLFACAR